MADGRPPSDMHAMSAVAKPVTSPREPLALGYSSATQPPALPEPARFLLMLFVDWMRRRLSRHR